jgi:hypothetical protein
MYSTNIGRIYMNTNQLFKKNKNSDGRVNYPGDPKLLAKSLKIGDFRSNSL